MKKEKMKEIIAESLYTLLKKYSFEDITVNMICEESGIGRSTFYRLFEDKQDVLVTFFIIHYQKIEDRYPNAENYVLMMKEYLDLIREYSSFFRKTLVFSDQNSLPEHIYNAGLQYYVHHVEEKSGRKIREDEYLAAVCFTNGITALVNEWIRSDFRIPPERYARYIFEAMPEKLAVWFRGEGIC